MADRKASVSLELRASQFKAEATVVEGKVEGVDRKVEKLDRDITKIPRDAAAASAAMRLLGDDAGRSALKLEDLGKSSTSMGMLDQRILHTRGELRRLADEFDRTGHAGTLQRLFKTGDELKDLERLRKRMTNALESGAREAGKGIADLLSRVGPQFSKSFWGAVSSLPPQVQAGIAAGIVGVIGVTAPFIGAAINGALLAGVGAGGLALGIVGQMHDPRIEAAASDLGTHLKASLTEASAPLGPVLLAGIQRMDVALSKALADLGPAFASLAPVLDRLFRGFEGLVANLMPGFAHGIEAGGKVLAQIADELPRLGHVLSMFFDMLADGSGGAADAMHYLFAIIEGTILALGVMLKTLSQNFQQLELIAAAATGNWAEVARILAEMKGHADGLGGSLATLGGIVGATGTSFDQLTAQISQTAVTSSTLAAAMSQKLFNSVIGVDQAMLGWHQSLTTLHDTLAENGRQIDKHTGQLDLNSKKGQENEQAILGVVTASMQQYQAFIAAGGSAKDAAAQYDINTQALIKQMRQAGYTQAQIDGLIGKYEGIPDIVNTELQFNGLTDAIRKLDELMRRINGLPYSREVRINVTTSAFAPNIPAYTSNPSAGGARGGRASGGPVMAGQSYIVGEHRPELFTPTVSGYITPSVSSYAATDHRSGTDFSGMRPSAAMGGAGGQTVIVNAPVTVNAGMGTDGAALGAQIAERLRPYISSLGGNVQQALGKRGR